MRSKCGGGEGEEGGRGEGEEGGGGEWEGEKEKGGKGMEEGRKGNRMDVRTYGQMEVGTDGGKMIGKEWMCGI